MNTNLNKNDENSKFGEFKGTKDIEIDHGSIFKPLSGYITVYLKNSNGFPVATIFAPDFEILKANALCFSKAPNLLQALQESTEALKWYMENSTSDQPEPFFNIGANQIEQNENLIKQATEL